ncbi:hypothetical protein ISS37_05545 [candidate division KSB1 bacterium]|nr:hypothetical protein [candidate division KSB1 bacterium]
MRVIEEVRILRLQIISLIFVFVSSVLIQYADFRISEYQNSVFLEILGASNLLQVSANDQLSSEFAAFKQFIPFERFSQENQKIIKNRIISSFKSMSYQDTNLADLNRKLENDSITLQQYFTEEFSIFDELSRAHKNQYADKVIVIKTALMEGTVWKSLKTYIFFPLQIIFILVLAYGYYGLMAAVSKRIATT